MRALWYACVFVRLFAYVNMCVCPRARVSVYVYAHVCGCVRVYGYACVCAHVCAYDAAEVTIKGF